MQAAGSLRLSGHADAASALTLTVDGETVPAVRGESVAAALLAAGRTGLRTDARGRPRGMLCGMGACFECRVSVDGGPPQRACLTPVTDSMQVRTLATPEPLPPAVAPNPEPRRRTLACDVLVVGSGPAGATAAARLAEAGRHVIVVDERHDAGGQYYKQKIPALAGAAPDDRQYAEGRRVIARLRNSGATLLNGTTVWGAFRGPAGQIEIAAAGRDRAWVLRPRSLVIAAGAYESVPPFPGWTLPGVMTTGAAQTLVRAYGVAPGRRVLIAGNGPLNLQLACELMQGGTEVVAVAESAPLGLVRHAPAAIGALAAAPSLVRQGIGYLRTLKKAGVPLYRGCRVVDAGGGGRLHTASIATIGPDDRPRPETVHRFDVDALCLGYRLRPSMEIARVLGCQVTDRGRLGHGIERGDAGATRVPGVFVIGDGAALGGAQVALAEGDLLADALLGRVPGRRESRRLRRHRRFQRHLWSLYEARPPAPGGPDSIACRCESVTVATVRELVESGVDDAGSLKRLCRVGMGHCQGRYCEATVAALIEEAAAAGPGFTVRNPVKPVTIGDIVAEKPEWRGYRSTGVPCEKVKATVGTAELDETDVLIVGAGVIGAAAALFLARAGIDTLLVDRGRPNGEASGGNAGSLHLQLLPFDVDADNGTSAAAAALPLQQLGIDLWMALERELDADFEIGIAGGLMLADSEGDLDFLAQKANLERSFGVETRILSAAETRSMLPGAADRVAGAAFCAGEGKINPLLATAGLLAAGRRAGTRLRTDTAVASIDAGHGGYRVGTRRGTIRCRRIVNAAGAWSAAIARLAGARLPVAFAPQQMLVTQPVDASVPYLLSLARRHLTMKQTKSGNLLIGGGWPGRFDAGVGRCVTTRESIEGNLWAAQRIFPPLGSLQLLRSWAAAGVMIDGLPVLGELPGRPGFYVAVGANGYTMAPIFGRVIADLVLGNDPAVDITAFSARRFGDTGSA